jgi:branched-chain amino acid transport system ATP-binding protein
MQMVRRFARTVSVLVHGRMMMTGAPADVMASPEVRSVYLGETGHARFATGGSHA